MVDVTSIITLSYTLATIPSSVQINKSQCQLLADRVMSLAGHLERMQGLEMGEKLEKGHEDVLARAQTVVVNCRDFMQSFQDGLWMAKAIFREKHKDRFQELHESLSYVFQILHLEIDYHSLSKRTLQADAADVTHMEERLASVAANMEKLEQSVTTMTDENKRQHDDVMAALKNVRIYRQTLDQDQLNAALSTAREQESLDCGQAGGKASSPLGTAGGTHLGAPGDEKSPPRTLGTSTGNDNDRDKRAADLADGVPLGVSSIGRPPKPVANQKQGATKEDTEQGDTSKGSRLQGDSSNGDNAKGGSQGDSLKGDTQVLRVVAKAAAAKASLGPPIRRKPFSQSYGVGLLEAGVTGGGWFDNPGSVVEPHVGEGGAKRGEYEVSFGAGPMGLSLKNVEARAEVSKVELGGAAHAAGVRPGDNVVGVNGRIPLGYTQVMGTLPTAPRPVRIRFIRGHGASWSPGGTVKRTHSSRWASNAIIAGVHHPAGDRGVLLEIYSKASFAPTPWIRSEGWDELPISPTNACGGPLPETRDGHADDPSTGTKDDAGSGANDVSDLSRWSGVRVGRAGKVTEIRLPGNSMTGVLPPSMGSLDELRTLELRENRLEGNIPESLRYLQKVTKVDFAHNLLEGSVPGGDARWINSMSIILLNNNKLSGHIPSTLGRLVNLTQLDLSFNKLSGTIPSELSKCRSLELLSMANNGITGSLPKSLGDLTRLKLLNIGNNKLTGPLPLGWGRLTSLQDLRLCHNALSGTIPDDMLVIPSLQLADLSCNCLEGEIPSSLGTCKGNLTDLDISRNSLSGEINSNIGGVHKLKKLNLEKNTIGGPLPTSLANLKGLESLNLSNNLLTGPLLHIQWGNLSNLEHLHLAHNKLGESLPSSLGALSSLVSLTLNANQLSGSIPRELHDLTALKLLDLSGNKIAPSSLLRNSFFSERRTLKKKLSACDVRF